MTKRLFDILFSFILIIIFLLPMLIISLIILFSSGNPILFWSKRIGKNCKTFLMPKFRTMKQDTPDVATHKLISSQKHITKIGMFIRKYSLDELPQFYSVLVGKMSIIGPRPALFNQYDLINLRKKRGINKLLPGITGWAQVNGRDNLLINEKVKLEEFYIQNKDLLLDFKIIVYTILKVLKKTGVSH